MMRTYHLNRQLYDNYLDGGHTIEDLHNRLPTMEDYSYPPAAQQGPSSSTEGTPMGSPLGSSTNFPTPLANDSSLLSSSSLIDLLTSTISSLVNDISTTSGEVMSGFDGTATTGGDGDFSTGASSQFNATGNFTEGSSSPAQFPYHMLGFTAACAFIIAILGASGNLLTIIALPMCRNLRTTATAFVVNLAVVELMFCVFVLPLSGAQYAYLMLYNQSLLSDKACIFFTVMRYSLTQLELQTIVAIALMRAMAVSFMSLYARVNTPRVVGVYIAILWIYSFGIRIPTAAGVFGHYRFNDQTMECDMGKDRKSAFARTIMLFLEALIPVMLIIVLYVFIFIMVKLSSNRVARSTTRRKMRVASSSSSDAGGGSATVCEDQDGEEERQSSQPDGDGGDLSRKMSGTSFKSLKRLMSDASFKPQFRRGSSTLSQKLSTNRRDMRVARTIFIIFVLIMFCSVPVMVVHFIDREAKNKRTFLAVHILYWLQYCINILIYVLMNRQYRDAYLDALSKWIPYFQRHRGFRFPWEAASQSFKPTSKPNQGSFRNRSGSKGGDDVQSSTGTEVNVGGAVGGHNRTGRLSAIQERRSSSVAADDSLSHEDATKKTRPAILPLATPPLHHRSAPQSPSSASPPQTPLFTNDHPFSSLPSSPLGCYPPPIFGNDSKTTSFSCASQSPQQQAASPSSGNSSPKIFSSEDSMKNLKDKLDTISVDSSTPLQAIEETEEPHLNQNCNDGGTKSSDAVEAKGSYSTVHGTSLDPPKNSVQI
uniref:G-protein coupled receptor moody-like n=2 Tax=Hirondellea gigas TaxID=1518452 RepID=A0A6A7G2W7_9CRUS